MHNKSFNFQTLAIVLDRKVFRSKNTITNQSERNEVTIWPMTLRTDLKKKMLIEK